MGYDLDKSPLSTKKDLVITFYWKFISPLPSDATIRISWIDANGNIIKSSETYLVDGYLPPEKISAGTIIRDAHIIEIPGDNLVQPQRFQVEWFSDGSKQSIGKPFVINKYLKISNN